MDLDMLQHPSTRRNIETLERWGHHQLNPTFGELASGLIGTGRMAEPQEIVTYLENFFSNSPLREKRLWLLPAQRMRLLTRFALLETTQPAKWDLPLLKNYPAKAPRLHW
jgi:phosphopantothenoylcysteine synthetase/decarboxylase